VFDDGNGPALYASGLFLHSGATSTERIARWDGTSWSPLGAGLNRWSGAQALAVFDDGDGPALFAGGYFHAAGDSGDSFLAKWGCADDGASFCFGHASDCPCANAGAPRHGCDDAGANGGVRLDVAARASGAATLVGKGLALASARPTFVLCSRGLEPVPQAFGDGLRCVSVSSMVRLGVTTSTGGIAQHVVTHPATAGAGNFYYQLWYRDTPSTYCDPFAAFNLSSGVRITWP
jgi:hypothetical protein